MCVDDPGAHGPTSGLNTSVTSCVCLVCGSWDDRHPRSGFSVTESDPGCLQDRVCRRWEYVVVSFPGFVQRCMLVTSSLLAVDLKTCFQSPAMLLATLRYLPYFYTRIFEYTDKPIVFNFFGDQYTPLRQLLNLWWLLLCMKSFIRPQVFHGHVCHVNEPGSVWL